MSSTTRFALPSPDGPENADVPLYLRNLANATDPWLSRSQPRTQAQINAITSPLLGQQVFNSDLGKMQEWNGAVWRPVGAGAFGNLAVGVLTVSTTFQTVAYFIGLGFTEVNFTFGPVNGTGGTSGAWITAVSDATRARGIITTGTASVIVNPSATTDAYTFSVGGTTNGRMRNIRLDADGFLRMELGTVTGTYSTAATDRINWGAR